MLIFLFSKTKKHRNSQNCRLMNALHGVDKIIYPFKRDFRLNPNNSVNILFRNNFSALLVLDSLLEMIIFYFAIFKTIPFLGTTSLGTLYFIRIIKKTANSVFFLFVYAF